MRLILISGLSGSGKSVALRALEDAGFYCVDNLPATLLSEAISLYPSYGYDQIAISVDVRSSPSLWVLPQEIHKLKAKGIDVSLLFLEARQEVLVKRFSETRRLHPLAKEQMTVEESICRERDMLADIQALGVRLDTSDLSANALRTWIHQLVQKEGHNLVLVFESFGFKYGLPQDADFVFDVRCLPNPFYDAALRPFSGRDRPIIDFFAQSSEVQTMINDIRVFLEKWLTPFRHENRSYLTIAIGCTGGHHRSVYVVEELAKAFNNEHVLVRHRQLMAVPMMT